MKQKWLSVELQGTKIKAFLSSNVHRIKLWLQYVNLNDAMTLYFRIEYTDLLSDSII